MRHTRKYLITALTLATFSSTNIVAEPLYPHDTVIVYANGIRTIRQIAEIDLQEFEARIRPRVESEFSSFSQDFLSFELSYFQSGGGDPQNSVIDVWRSFQALLGNNLSTFWRVISGVGIPEELEGNVRDWLYQTFENEIAAYQASRALEDNPDVQRQVNLYNESLEQCKRIVAVGHSSGAVMTNIAQTGINPTLEDAFGVVAIGTIDSYVAGQGPHTILEEDFFARSVSTLPANVNNYGLFETYSPFHGHSLFGNYLDPGHPAEEKILDNIIAMMEQVQSFDNIDYCGWPASYARSVDVYFDPASFETSEEAAQEQWSYLWQAAVSGDLIIEFSPVGASNWTTLKNYGPRTDRWVEYNYNNPMPFDPDYESAPFIFINNNYLSGGYDFSRTVEIQIDDDNPAGEYRYRFIIDNKVVDQIKILQHPGIWNEVYTSNPIDDSLPSGSLPIFPLP